MMVQYEIAAETVLLETHFVTVLANVLLSAIWWLV